MEEPVALYRSRERVARTAPGSGWSPYDTYQAWCLQRFYSSEQSETLTGRTSRGGPVAALSGQWFPDALSISDVWGPQAFSRWIAFFIATVANCLWVASDFLISRKRNNCCSRSKQVEFLIVSLKANNVYFLRITWSRVLPLTSVACLKSSEVCALFFFFFSLLWCSHRWCLLGSVTFVRSQWACQWLVIKRIHLLQEIS